MATTSTCTVRGCERPAQARGYCNTHYSRWRKTGTPAAPSRATLADRLWARVEVTPEGCWEFTGHRNEERGGYGRIRLTGERVTIGAHVAAWLVTHGPVPEGLIVRHRCDNPPCCNPAHLELGTYAQNTADMVARGRALLGSRNPGSKLTEEQVAEIREARSAGDALGVIAARFGVSKSLVSLIARGLVWKEPK
jgi:hypothetical protein